MKDGKDNQRQEAFDILRGQLQQQGFTEYRYRVVKIGEKFYPEFRKGYGIGAAWEKMKISKHGAVCDCATLEEALDEIESFKKKLKESTPVVVWEGP